MRWVSRRRLLCGLFALSAVLVAACGGGGPEESGGGETVPRIAYTAPDPVSTVNRTYGMLEWGEKFGFEATEDDITVFNDHATATQAVLSGRQDVLSGSFGSLLQVREQGQDFKAFCPYINSDDYVMAGRGGVTELNEIFEPGVKVAVDSPGGAADLILTGMLTAQGIDKSAKDIPDPQIITSSDLRTTALASGDVDASFIHLTQFNKIKSEVEDAVILGNFYQSVDAFIKEAFQAPSEWIDQNLETATSLCASVIKGSQVLASDFDELVSASQKYAEEPPGRQEIRVFYDLVQDHNFWPTEGQGFEPEAVDFMIDTTQSSGLIEERPNPEDLIDHRPLDGALKMLEEQK